MARSKDMLNIHTRIDSDQAVKFPAFRTGYFTARID
jgi:hypothetical protein